MRFGRPKTLSLTVARGVKSRPSSGFLFLGMEVYPWHLIKANTQPHKVYRGVSYMEGPVHLPAAKHPAGKGGGGGRQWWFGGVEKPTSFNTVEFSS